MLLLQGRKFINGKFSGKQIGPIFLLPFFEHRPTRTCPKSPPDSSPTHSAAAAADSKKRAKKSRWPMAAASVSAPGILSGVSRRSMGGYSSKVFFSTVRTSCHHLPPPPPPPPLEKGRRLRRTVGGGGEGGGRRPSLNTHTLFPYIKRRKSPAYFFLFQAAAAAASPAAAAEDVPPPQGIRMQQLFPFSSPGVFLLPTKRSIPTSLFPCRSCMAAKRKKEKKKELCLACQEGRILSLRRECVQHICSRKEGAVESVEK